MKRARGVATLVALALGLACTSNNAGDSRSPDERDLELQSLEADATRASDVTIKQVEARRAVSPIRLEAVDGSELPLNRLVARADLDQPLAFTELEMEFLNPEGRPLDAWLAVSLPDGARVTRFATYVDGGWKEAEVVPRSLTGFRKLVGDPREPAVLRDHDSAQFRARVFPVAANRPTRVVVSYVQELRGTGQVYRLPLSGITSRLDSLMLHIRGKGLRASEGAGTVRREDGDEVYKRVAKNVRPREDVVLEFSGDRKIGIRHESMVVARLQSPVPHDHSAALSGLAVLVDTSASQAHEYGRYVDRLGEVLRAIKQRTPEDIRLRVITFDQQVETLYDGRISGFGRDQLRELHRRPPLGASNLAWALRHVSRSKQLGFDRVLIVSDGVVTAGPSSVEELRAEVAALGDAGIRRVDVVTRGDLSDYTVAHALTRSDALAENGLVLRSDDTAKRIALRIARTVVDDLRVVIPGSRWVYPERIEPLQAGDDVVVYAEVPERGDIDVVLRGQHVDPRPHKLQLHDARRPLLESAWAGARARFLTDEYHRCVRDRAGLCEQWMQRVESWSQRHRILNEFTAMVMLAPSEDYQRFGIDRAAPEDVLVYGDAGVELRARAVSSLETAVASAARPTPYWKARSHVLTPEYKTRPEPWEEAARVEALAAAAKEAQRVAEVAGERGDVTRGRVSDTDDLSELVGRVGAPKRPARGDKARAPRTSPKHKPEPPRVRTSIRPTDAYDDDTLVVMRYLGDGELRSRAIARNLAEDWRQREPDSVIALVALGEAYEASDRLDAAARAYGSLIDLFPGRPDMRRYAAERIERLDRAYEWLVLDSYARALEQDPEDPTTHRLLAIAQLRSGEHAAAFDTLVDGIAWARASRKYRSAVRIMREDLALVGAAWLRAQPDERDYILRALDVQNVALAQEPSLRFVLTWETDAND
ncbi:MAG: hypothetical protein KC468_24115, partial [Myxococcales bacterium]|nr:hypothetical protein [Myxococcales bacterium]